jgi:hypothetical protein
MPTLHTEIEIAAAKSQVWQTLVRKDAWKYWNTFLYDCDPRRAFQEGYDVFLSLKRLPGEEETEFQPRITRVMPNVCLRWVSTFPGFIHEQTFELQDLGRDRTLYIHQEKFSGILTRVVFPFIRQDEYQGMKRMARELKWHLEGNAVV